MKRSKKDFFYALMLQKFTDTYRVSHTEDKKNQFYVVLNKIMETVCKKTFTNAQLLKHFVISVADLNSGETCLDPPTTSSLSYLKVRTYFIHALIYFWVLTSFGHDTGLQPKCSQPAGRARGTAVSRVETVSVSSFFFPFFYGPSFISVN